MLPRLFKTLPNGREVWAWGVYDLANQSFQLLINTLLLGIYIKNVVATDPARGTGAWTMMVASAMLLVVLLSPFLGALADARAWKKELLITSGIIASVLTACLAFMGPGTLTAAMTIYIVAAVMVGLGENFLGSFLPELATPQTMGRVSAIGWTMSYIGAIALLGITALAVFGLGLRDPAQWRWLFVLAAVWFFLGMIPAMTTLRERARPLPPAARANPFTDTLRQLRATIRESSRYRQLRRFFLAAFVYSMGTYTVIFFAGMIGDSFGFQIGQLTLLALVMALAAGCGSVFTARHQDRLGHRRTILLFLGAWVISTSALALMSAVKADQRWFWVISAGMGIGLGGIGTASRALVGAFTPPAKSGEFFGVWGMVFKLSAIVGVGAFGAAAKFIGQTASLAVLTAFFLVGALLMLRVNEAQGIQAAHGPQTAPDPAA